MDFVRFVIGALACWRITSLLIREAGPFDLLVKFRSLTGRYRVMEGALSCVWCLSMWVGILVSVVMLSDYWLTLTPFALSAAAIGFEEAKNGMSRNVSSLS